MTQELELQDLSPVNLETKPKNIRKPEAITKHGVPAPLNGTECYYIEFTKDDSYTNQTENLIHVKNIALRNAMYNDFINSELGESLKTKSLTDFINDYIISGKKCTYNATRYALQLGKEGIAEVLCFGTGQLWPYVLKMSILFADTITFNWLYHMHEEKLNGVNFKSRKLKFNNDKIDFESLNIKERIRLPCCMYLDLIDDSEIIQYFSEIVLSKDDVIMTINSIIDAESLYPDVRNAYRNSCILFSNISKKYFGENQNSKEIENKLSNIGIDIITRYCCGAYDCDGLCKCDNKLGPCYNNNCVYCNVCGFFCCALCCW